MKCKRNRVYRQQLFWVLFYSPPILGVFFWKHIWSFFFTLLLPIGSVQLLLLAYAICLRTRATLNSDFLAVEFVTNCDQSGSFSLLRNHVSSLWNLGLGIVFSFRLIAITAKQIWSIPKLANTHFISSHNYHFG